MTLGEAFEELARVMHRLRAPGGCPWDGEQTHRSLTPYLIEEAYEVIEAIESGDDEELCEELGDLLLQSAFHAELARERDAFTLLDVVRRISEKLVRRHPHVFGDTVVSGTSEVLRNWAQIKAKEREDSGDRSALAGVPRAMPALLRAQRLGEKAAQVGFDWDDISGVLRKLHEELDEIEQAIRVEDCEAAADELGDLLFTATSLARHLRHNAERALGGAADRFTQRFRSLEAALAERRRDIRDATTTEKEALWEQIKQRT